MIISSMVFWNYLLSLYSSTLEGELVKCCLCSGSIKIWVVHRVKSQGSKSQGCDDHAYHILKKEAVEHTTQMSKQWSLYFYLYFLTAFPKNSIKTTPEDLQLGRAQPSLEKLLLAVGGHWLRDPQLVSAQRVGDYGMLSPKWGVILHSYPQSSRTSVWKKRKTDCRRLQKDSVFQTQQGS